MLNILKENKNLKNVNSDSKIIKVNRRKAKNQIDLLENKNKIFKTMNLKVGLTRG